ncbi:MAG TPA: winged helix-turn-helix domain-containing protein [Blastocatellia bacterium]|nr:winged helix-turn-helix domain-containing protein [Blastocatellia bacterium]
MAPNGGQSYRFGDFTLEASEHRLRRKGEEVPLRPKAFETLLYLVERHGHLVEKDELLERLWAETAVTEGVLTHCITEVRQALQDEAHNPRYLKTIPRVGYKFIGKVEKIASAAQAPEPVKTGTHAIAVLPFVNLSAEPENEYLCDGLAEELINGLTKVRELRVVAHSSSFSFKGQSVDAREIGWKLNVGWVVEGSVRKVASRVRISAQLINAADGYHLWSEQYDRQMEDLFAIQDEISLAILERLKVKLLGREKASLVKRYTEDLEAYHLYLKGRYFWHRRYEGFMQKAQESFQQAIERDPLYAPAYTGLADTYNSLGVWGFMAPGDVFPRARAMAHKALEIDDTLGEAHASSAFVNLFYDWDWAAAERGFKRASELSPGYALSHLWYAHYLSLVGRFDEAIGEAKQAQFFDPLSPIINANVGWTYYLIREYGRAIEELRKTLHLDPHCGMAHLYMGYTYAQAGRYEEAIEALQRAIDTTERMSWTAESLGYVYGLAGKRERAEKILHESETLSKERYVPSSALALIYLGLGEHDKVFEWLDRAYDERDALLPWLSQMPEFDAVRSDPRFRDLLRRMWLASSPHLFERPSKTSA